MKRSASISITRRLVITVLILELLSAVALIGAITVHEWSVQLEIFDGALVADAESLMGAVQDTEDEGDNVMLDMRAVRVAKDAVFRVEDERGKMLGFAGDPPHLETSAAAGPLFRNTKVRGRDYRFLVLNGTRIVDPGKANGGVRHSITIIYGTPLRHVWHEVQEAVRFFAIATAFLLGITAVVMAWLVRKGLSPVHDLAREAERIQPGVWQFHAPLSAKETTELRPLAGALEAALGRLQRSFEQQKRFTSDAAHELKTDVAIVKSSLQLLSMRKRTLEEYGQGLAVSLEDITRLESTVEKMLTLARLEQPAESYNASAASQSCSLRNVIYDAVHHSSPFAQLKSIEVAVEINADVRLPIDSRDALLLSSNILLNALQHSPDHATVHITVTADEGIARLTVRDQGEGISDEDCDHVFEPYYRGDPSRSRKSGGTGLGLSICKAICERAGGSIEIANHTAGGALVTVTLPAVVEVSSTLSASLKAE